MTTAKEKRHGKSKVRDPSEAIDILGGTLLVLDEMTSLDAWPKEGIRRLVILAKTQVEELAEAVQRSQEPVWLDYHQLAERYHLGRKLALRLVAEGQIKAAEVDGRRKKVFLESSVLSYLKKRSTRRPDIKRIF